jgi:hypothetical protein
MGLDTKTYWLTDRKSQCDFHFELGYRNEGVSGVGSRRWLKRDDNEISWQLQQRIGLRVPELAVGICEKVREFGW